MGIGSAHGRTSVTDYVLSDFTEEEQEAMAVVVGRCADACEAALEKPFMQVMNEFN